MSDPQGRSALRETVDQAAQTRTPEGPAVRALQQVAMTAPPDRTVAQVRQQLTAFQAAGITQFEVQPMPPKGSSLKRERIQQFDAEGVEKVVPWLRRMNASGYDIFVRPLSGTEDTAPPFVFVDDIDQATVDRIRADGHTFAALVESSVARFHGWLRVADAPLDRGTVSRAGRLVAERYGADPASSDWRHYGRLCGFTNQKPSRRTPRGAPFALLRGSSPAPAPNTGAVLLAEARADLDREARETAEARALADQQRRSAARAFNGRTHELQDATALFSELHATARTKVAGDESAQDFAAAMSLLRRGYSRDQVEEAMRNASPSVAKRAAAQQDDYLRRTLDAAESRVQGTPTTSTYRRP